MALLTEQEKQRIAEAVSEVEKHTSGELVTVIARRADNYLYIPLLAAAMLALAAPAVVNLIGNSWALSYNYLIQIAVFLVFGVLFRLPPLTMMLVPPAVKQQRAHRLAMEQFFARNLHHTAERTGILLFVSLAEHYVEIIADKGINDKVTPDIWQGVVDNFIRDVKSARPADGFMHAVKACGELLQAHFPATGENHNELADHLVEIQP
ncbi:MAG: TPM domain-containing protein [Gammaproteobacteria bacterium]|nr:TPM domain-containing protein [Gammaproteobacteria bacterium]